jgi:tRNA(adenine34) deaminase
MYYNYKSILLKLAKNAFKKGEVPVAAIIVKNNKIISKAHNKRYRSNNPLYHAEIQCIIKASKKLKDWRLDNCDLYVTLKPCHMCEEILKEVRINNVYYLVESNKVINFKTNFIKIHDDKKTFENLLTNFFKNLR